MLDYYTLSKKPKINIDNELTIDLLHKTVDLSKELSGQFVEVNEYYVARPDLISLAIYGDDKYGDIICKVNGISNPFELNEGQIIFLPTYETINDIIDMNATNNTTKVLSTDDEIISNSNRIGAQKRKDEERSPAQQLIGDQNYIIDKSLGIVFY